MTDLTPEEKERIYEEEKARKEAKQKLREEENRKNAKGCLVAILVFIGIIAGLASLSHLSEDKVNVTDYPSQAGFETMAHHISGKGDLAYAVYVDHQDYSKMKRYAKKFPYDAGSMTSVFFFDSRESMPRHEGHLRNLSAEHSKHCVAAYWKYKNGTEKFLEDYNKV